MTQLIRRTIAYKILPDKAFNVEKNPKCGRFQRGRASMIYRFFDKKDF